MKDKDHKKGIQLMILGLILLPVMDAIAKFLGETMSSSLIVLSRFTVQSIILIPFVIKILYWPKGKELLLHFLRALSICIATLCFFTAIVYMPLADALAVFFVMPLFVTILSPWLLKETFKLKQLIAVLIGLIGALFIIGPSYENFGFNALLPLGTAGAFSLYYIFTRKVINYIKQDNRVVSANIIQFFSGLFGSILLIGVITIIQPFEISIFKLSMPNSIQMFFMLMVGLFAVLGHGFITTAFKYVDASTLAPLQYLELVSAAVLGLIFFNDFPTLLTWLGCFIIVLSGLYILKLQKSDS